MAKHSTSWGPRLLDDGTYVDRPRPSWRYLAVVTGVGLAAGAATGLAFGDERWMVAALALGALWVVLELVVWVQSRVTYRLDRESLTVRVGLRRRRLPYNSIRDFRRLPSATHTFGSRPSGVVEVNATTLFPLRMMPTEPDEFIRELTVRVAAFEARLSGPPPSNEGGTAPSTLGR